MLRLDERAPPLKSISGQTLNIYGRKLVAFEIEGKRWWLNFYVCDVPYSVVSVARLLQQGCKATLTSEGSRHEGPSGEVMPVVSELVSLDPEEYANFSATFHAVCCEASSRTCGSTFKPTIQYHADKWVLDSANPTLTRLHKRVRTTLFSPEGTKDRPIDLKDLTNERTTYLEFEDGSTISVIDDWRTSDAPRAVQEKRFKGTVFKLASVPTGRKLLGKQSTLEPPEPLEVKPQKIKDSKLQAVPPPTSQASNPLAAEYKDTFTDRLFQALAADGSYDGLESFVTKSLRLVRLMPMTLGLSFQPCGLDFIGFPVQRSLCQESNFKEVRCCLT